MMAILSDGHAMHERIRQPAGPEPESRDRLLARLLDRPRHTGNTSLGDPTAARATILDDSDQSD